jgi:hypothetical protein
MESGIYKGYRLFGHAIRQLEDILLPERYAASGTIILETKMVEASGVAQSSLAATSARWCPGCLAEDRDSGRTPYFRLAWDVGAVDVCTRHKTRLEPSSYTQVSPPQP